MKIDFYKKNGEKDLAIEYPKSLVSEVSDSRVLEYVKFVQANMRVSTADTKDRSEVRGGGKKPWKQKGTGRARHGSSRSPIWVGGGITFGPTSDRNYSVKLNKREKKAALLSAIYSKVKEGVAIGVTEIKFSAPKTAEAANLLGKLPINGKIVVFAPELDNNFAKSFKNIPFVTLVTARKVNIVKLISSSNILFTKESLKELENHFNASKNEEQVETVIVEKVAPVKKVAKKEKANV